LYSAGAPVRAEPSRARRAGRDRKAGSALDDLSPRPSAFFEIAIRCFMRLWLWAKGGDHGRFYEIVKHGVMPTKAADFFTSIVRPTVDEFLCDTTDIRRGRLAAIVLYHMKDYWQLEHTTTELMNNLDFSIIRDC
jgi:hypothetical protein